MKYLKNVLLATGLIATTLGMSMSANAGAIVTQEIIVDVDFAAANPFDIVEGMDQVIGSISYAVEDRDSEGFLATDSTVLNLQIGNLSLTLADDFEVMMGGDILAGSDPLEFIAGIEFLTAVFVLTPDYDLVLDVGPLSSSSFFLENFATGEFDVTGEARFGEMTLVPEPSALILMLAGLGLLVRRKVAAK